MKFIRAAGFERELRRSGEFEKAMREQAERVKRRAEQASPTGGTGGYARRFTVTVGGETPRVGNTDIAAHLVEFGSVNNPPYAPLRRGVRAAGLRLEEDH